MLDPAKLVPTTAEIDDLQFLKNNDSPWEVIEAKWKKTFNVRCQKIIEMKTIKELLEVFPLFSNLQLGHILVTFPISIFKKLLIKKNLFSFP